MLTAHANTPIHEFIAQLRTYVIALGLGPQVVDCVDRLADVDELEREHEAALVDAEDDAATKTKSEIIEAIDSWLLEHNIPTESVDSLYDAIEAV